MIVHVVTQGAKIIREGARLLVRKDGNTYNTLFAQRLRQLLLYGNVSLTSQALKALLRENVDTVFLGVDGRYHGRLELPESRNVFLRKRQFELADDQSFRLRLARSFVQGKLQNMATLMLRVQRTRRIQETGAAAGDIRALAQRTKDAETLDIVRGLEGAASARYFGVLRYGFVRDFGFRRRVRRPPTDPVNGVLSLLYTFCINRMYSAVRQAGLDPYVGALHDLDYGRHSLPLDLVEEFRPIVADALTLSLFNLQALSEEDFFTVEPPAPVEQVSNSVDAACRDPLHAINVADEESFDLPEQAVQPWTAPVSEGKRPVRLRPPAFKRVIEAFEKKMESEFHHPLAERTMTYAQAMVFQARQYRCVLEGETAEYAPLLLK